MARFGGDFDPVTDPTVVYDQYSTGGAQEITIPAVPGSTAITVINGITGPTINFSGGTTGLTFTPAGVTITLNGTLVIANGGTGATTVAGILANLGIAKQNSDTVDPTVSDDNTLGYSVNSLWTNTTGPKGFICLDASTGAAAWQLIS